MADLSIPVALLIVIFWPLGLALCMWKYLRSLRMSRKADAWIWLIAWCAIIAMVEWFAFAGYVLVKTAF